MSEKKSPTPVVKVTLSTKKVIFLRHLKISDTETAAEMVAQRANGDSNLMQIFMQKALLELILVAVNDLSTPLNPIQRKQMDSLFSPGEYAQILKVVGKMAGADDAKKDPEVEFADM